MTIDFDKKAFIPMPSSWFSIDVQYQGQGRAEFLNPQGVVQGKTTIQFNELGESNIEMQVEDIHTEQPLTFGLMELLSGSKSYEVGNEKKLKFGTNENICKKLKITTPDGVFSANDDIHYGLQIGDSESKIKFNIPRPEFDVDGAKEAKYWVIPLLNFISDFAENEPILDNHPLRLFPTPIVPKDYPEQNKRIAIHIANQKNRLIIFKFNESLGFIEPLPDFIERKNSLLDKQSLTKITSVMIGEVRANPIEFENLYGWFPFDFLLLLGIASGAEVGAPWIEFRDVEGKLVKRIHSSWGQSLFLEGHPAIRENTHRGTGYLLTKAQSSSKYNLSSLRVAIKNVVRGGLYNLSLENKLRHIFLVFDNLADDYGIRRTLALKRQNERLINTLIKETNKTINEMARQAREDKNQLEAEILQRIAQQISEAKIVQTGFKQNVMDLLVKFDLPDANIISRYYKENPRPDKRKWADVLAYYRGIVMHRSYFDVQEGHHDINDILRILHHLHDILIRIIFIILGYDQTYQPTVIAGTIKQPIDWVKSSTPASHLGY